MKLTVLANRLKDQAKGRTPAECAPSGPRPYGPAEAKWSGGAWVAVPEWLEVLDVDLPVREADYEVELSTRWGYMRVMASNIYRGLVDGS